MSMLNENQLNIVMRILTLLLLLSNYCFAQYIGAERIEQSKLSPYWVDSVLEYAGVYHFGESESESDFNLFFVNDGSIIGQIVNGYWEEGIGIWKTNYQVLTNIKIDGKGNFISDQYSGQFVQYKSDLNGNVQGLKIDNSWTSWLRDSVFEVGVKSSLKYENIFAGKYPQASFRRLKIEELSKMSVHDLKVMRNEIFARYAYVFHKGGQMDTYFRKQEWYRPQHNDVSAFLTEIELYNVCLIKQMEGKRNNDLKQRNG